MNIRKLLTHLSPLSENWRVNAEGRLIPGVSEQQLSAW